MLIDAAYWRSNQVTKSLFNLEPPKRLFADQDILNEYFKNNWSQLPATYNYSANTLQLTANGYRCANGEKPAVIHFNGGIKPWKYWVRGSFIYWRYIWKTPYKSLIFAAPKTVLNSMMHFLKKRM
jgi:lipopolysaccharide biosynthesis glycosyltransferase